MLYDGWDDPEEYWISPWLVQTAALHRHWDPDAVMQWVISRIFEGRDACHDRFLTPGGGEGLEEAPRYRSARLVNC